MIEQILDNPVIKKALLSKIEKAFESEGITLITIAKKEDGELNFEVYKELQVIVPKADYDFITEKIKEL